MEALICSCCVKVREDVLCLLPCPGSIALIRGGICIPAQCLHSYTAIGSRLLPETVLLSGNSGSQLTAVLPAASVQLRNLGNPAVRLIWTRIARPVLCLRGAPPGPSACTRCNLCLWDRSLRGCIGCGLCTAHPHGSHAWMTVMALLLLAISSGA